MFNGSYIKVILDIAETDPKCKLSFVKSDIENARKELFELQAAQQSVQPTACTSCGSQLRDDFCSNPDCSEYQPRRR